MRPRLPDRPGIIAPPPAIYALALLIGLGAHWLVPLSLFSWPIAAVVGGPLVAAGALLMAWAFAAMRRARTSVNPYRPSSAVVVDGPYRWSRNPIYLGMTVGYAGATLLVGTAWALVLLPLVLVVMTRGVIVREERYLEQVFGDAYTNYRREVRRWL